MSEGKKSRTLKYTNGEVTVVWKPDVCIHAANCVNGLPGVFDAKAKPWINMDGANTAEIVAQVKKCPSGALSTYMNAEGADGPVKVETERLIEVAPNGPLMVYGNVTIKSANGTETRDSRVTAFCRCGASQNKPYCDGSHKKIGFEG